MEAAAPVEHLGYDQVLSILRRLPAEAVLSFAATCRAFRAWASSDVLWEALFRRDCGGRAAAALAERRRDRPWRRVYADVARLGALSARRLRVKGVSPRPRASHSLNLVAGWLVVFGGGCEGGNCTRVTSAVSFLFGIACVFSVTCIKKRSLIIGGGTGIKTCSDSTNYLEILIVV